MRLNPGQQPLVVVALGANIGRPLEQLSAAIHALAEVVEPERISAVYRTEPEGFRDQPEFLNLVFTGRSSLDPRELLARAQQVEVALGRDRPFPGAPRSIDIDLLAVGERVENTPSLILPHPRMHLRAFVLVPLAEIAPDWQHPVLKLTPDQMLRAAAPPLGRVELFGRLRL